jgi:hypothetical protein
VVGWISLGFPVEAGRAGGPGWVTLVRGGETVSVVGVDEIDRDHSKSRLLTWVVGSFSATFSLPFFDFDFDFDFAPEIAAAALEFSRVTPGANASRGASSGTTKNALISN